jgi:hypothetical protein
MRPDFQWHVKPVLLPIVYRDGSDFSHLPACLWKRVDQLASMHVRAVYHAAFHYATI